MSAAPGEEWHPYAHSAGVGTGRSLGLGRVADPSANLASADGQSVLHGER